MADPKNDKQFQEFFSTLANALQSASALSTELRQRLGSEADIAVKLEAQVDRAVRAVRAMRPTNGEEAGS